MSDLPLTDAISDRYLAGIEQACTEGRGREHMLTYFRDVARHVAGAAFMWCDAESGRAKLRGESAEAFLDLIERYCDGQRAKVVSWVRLAFGTVGIGGAEADILAFEDESGRAFSAELERLFGATTGQEGSA